MPVLGEFSAEGKFQIDKTLNYVKDSKEEVYKYKTDKIGPVTGQLQKTIHSDGTETTESGVSTGESIKFIFGLEYETKAIIEEDQSNE